MNFAFGQNGRSKNRQAGVFRAACLDLAPEGCWAFYEDTSHLAVLAVILSSEFGLNLLFLISDVSVTRVGVKLRL